MFLGGKYGKRGIHGFLPDPPIQGDADETQIQSVESADSSIEEELANGDEEQLNEDLPHLFKVGRFLLIT